jgi:hypothetical protein
MPRQNALHSLQLIGPLIRGARAAPAQPVAGCAGRTGATGSRLCRVIVRLPQTIPHPWLQSGREAAASRSVFWPISTP